MHADRFDALTRILTASNSRRRALALALIGVLRLRGRARPDDATADGKCKPKCAECKKCKKGKKGSAEPKADGSECSTGTCQSGSCVAPAICTDPIFLHATGSDCCSGSCDCPGGGYPPVVQRWLVQPICAPG